MQEVPGHNAFQGFGPLPMESSRKRPDWKLRLKLNFPAGSRSSLKVCSRGVRCLHRANYAAAAVTARASLPITALTHPGVHVILVQLPILRLRDPVEDADEIAEESPDVARDDYPWNLKQLAEAHGPLADLRQLPHPGPIEVGGKNKERHWQDYRMNRTVSDGDEDCRIEQEVSTVYRLGVGDVAVAACVDEILHKQGLRVFPDMVVDQSIQRQHNAGSRDK